MVIMQFVLALALILGLLLTVGKHGANGALRVT
jgi:hypothetical protein